jgi:FKBP-type peptidyl-prolyl cis-trans isomerase FklB
MKKNLLLLFSIITISISSFSQDKSDIERWNDSVLKDFSNTDLSRLKSGSPVYNQIRFNLLSDKYFKPIFGKSFESLKASERNKIEGQIRRLKNKSDNKWASKLDFYLWGVWGHKNQMRAYEDAIIEIQKIKDYRSEFNIALQEIQSGKLSTRELLESKWNKALANKIYLLPSELGLIKSEIDKQIQIQEENREGERANRFLTINLDKLLAKTNDELLINKLEEFIVAIDDPASVYADALKKDKENAKKLAQEKIEQIKNTIQSTSVKEETFFRENAKKTNVVVLPSGVQYEVIVQTEGPKPNINSQVTIHYIGTTIDGKPFEDTYDVGVPYTDPIKNFIPALQQVLPLMSVGSKYRIYSPYQFAYGERGYYFVKPYSTVIIEVELMDFE